MAERKYWLFKSEPTAYSFGDLLSEPDQTAEWDGIRNYQVRNLMRDEMRVGDGVLFYHGRVNGRANSLSARMSTISHTGLSGVLRASKCLSFGSQAVESG